MKLDYAKITDIEMHIGTHYAPEFCDCYIESANYDGREMTEDEINELNDDRDFVYQCAIDRIY